jgi:HD-GYP domain-containing protein (c-di-GMP phosphodiesterase class II)
MKKVIKSISIREAKKDMVLANTVRDKKGNIIFPKEHKLDYSSINTINNSGITFIYIYQVSPVINPITKPQILVKTAPKSTKIVEEVFTENKKLKPTDPAPNINEEEEKKYSIPASPKEKPPLKDVISIEIREKGEKLVKEMFSDPKHIKYDEATKLVSKIVDDIIHTHESIVSVNDLRSYDNYTYQHSVNLCVLGTTVGKMLNYDEQKLREFGIGLLFHDFGKTKIPLEILNKPGRLTVEEFDIMKGHAEFGYQILSQKYKLPEIAKQVIRHHHEKLDGSGYPHGLKGSNISEWVQIATIVDIYDALTSDRIYKSHWTHQSALDFLYERSDKWFNKDFIKALQTTVPKKLDTFSLLDF